MKAEKDYRLLSRDEVEETFGVSRRFLELAVARGDGPAVVRIGRSVRYRVSDILSWIDSCIEEKANG